MKYLKIQSILELEKVIRYRLHKYSQRAVLYKQMLQYF